MGYSSKYNPFRQITDANYLPVNPKMSKTPDTLRL